MEKRPPCSVCGKPNSPDYRPFCSKRCADVDLSRWLTGGYVIKSRDDEEEDSIAAHPDEGDD
ncbi:MAG: DNA gyrase inhibitor YacG [Caulobacteraceae bacterium]